MRHDRSLTRAPSRNGRHSLGSSSLLSSSSSLLDASGVGRRRPTAPPRWGDLEGAPPPSRSRAKARRRKLDGGLSADALPSVTRQGFRLARASTPSAESPPPPPRQVLSRQETLLDRDRRHLYAALARTSELAWETSTAVAELDSRHQRVKQLQEWTEAEGYGVWQQPPPAEAQPQPARVSSSASASE
jgi:hypothetical protein